MGPNMGPQRLGQSPRLVLRSVAGRACYDVTTEGHHHSYNGEILVGAGRRKTGPPKRACSLCHANIRGIPAASTTTMTFLKTALNSQPARSAVKP